MNSLWDTPASQQSNKISPPSATACMRSVSVMIGSTSTTVLPALTVIGPQGAHSERSAA